MKDWTNDTLIEVIDKLEKSISSDFHVETGDCLGRSGRKDILQVLDSILALFFPGCYSDVKVSKENLNFFLNDVVRHISFTFLKVLNDVFHYHCKKDRCSNCDCFQRSEDIMKDFIGQLPNIREQLLLDVRAAMSGDPAAGSLDEIVLSYPFVDAVATYRIAHALYEQGVPIIPRIMSERAHSRTGIDIHPGAKIGKSFFIDHGTGVVIGETCRLGDNVKIYQGVTLGAVSPFDAEGIPRKGEKRHPDIEDNVIIYANATILGGKTVIGKGAIIGGNTWITESIAPDTLVYNSIPKDMIKKKARSKKTP